MRDFPADEAVPGYALDTMRVHDLPRVLEIERACFNDPWSRSAFLYEIRDNKVALNHVLRCMAQAGRVDAYSCLYFLEDELEINNIAVDAAARRRGLARFLMAQVLREGRRRGTKTATLQVRPTNRPALALYESFGFIKVGRRRRYYSDTGEDALLMSVAL